MNSQSEAVAVRGVKGAVRPAPTGVECPRCRADSVIELEKADPETNTVFRCRPCGHIFSPKR